MLRLPIIIVHRVVAIQINVQLQYWVVRRGAEVPGVVRAAGIVHVQVPVGVDVRVGIRWAVGDRSSLGGLAGGAGRLRFSAVNLSVTVLVIATDAHFHAGGSGIPIAVADGATIVLPDQPTDVRLARDPTDGIAGSDRAAVLPHQPADIGPAFHSAGGIDGRDRGATAVRPDQPADSATAGRRDSARGIAGSNGATVVLPCQPAGIILAFHSASGIAVNDGAAVQPHQPADLLVAGDLPAGGRVAVGDCAAGGVQPDQPTDFRMSFDSAGGVAVADRAAVVPAHQSADFRMSFDSAGGVAVTDGAALPPVFNPTRPPIRSLVLAFASLPVTSPSA